MGVSPDVFKAFKEGITDDAMFSIDGFHIDPESYDLSQPNNSIGVAAHAVDLFGACN